jgi:hypothetical protein
LKDLQGEGKPGYGGHICYVRGVEARACTQLKFPRLIQVSFDSRAVSVERKGVAITAGGIYFEVSSALRATASYSGAASCCIIHQSCPSAKPQPTYIIHHLHIMVQTTL